MVFSKQTFPIHKTKLFSNLFEDYIDNKEGTHSFFNHHFSNTASLQIKESKNLNRQILIEVLDKQSDLVINTSEITKKNISKLINKETFTITTGHQLCLFSGPLYFIYKIASTIQLCKAYEVKHPNYTFVPVYWMATEDHDFEEVNHAYVFGKKITWNSNQKGSVGDFMTSELDSVISELSNILGTQENAQELIKLFQDAYLGQTNLANATRFLVNELFGKYGIIILDGNDKALKSLFKDEMKADIFDNKALPIVNKTINKLKGKYPVQVNPREVNFFYKEKSIRERIEKRGNEFIVVNTNLVFSKSEMEQLIENFPERFSPNVVTRPLFQQKILPNIAYVGGPGELAYWLQYKSMFDEFNIQFPILVPRQFLLILDKNIQNKIQKFNLSIANLFEPIDILIKQFIKEEHHDFNLDEVRKKIDLAFSELSVIAEKIDKSLIASAEAEKQKAINGILALEQKINKSLKKKEETNIEQLCAIKEKLFPNDKPQERHDNLSMYIVKYGFQFIDEIVDHCHYSGNDFDYTVLSEI